jgi:hypothetical protein
MVTPAADYDPRYLAGILLFNARDFFEAHDVWEELWADCRGPEQRFYQGLIQAAVGLFHYSGGNVRGAAKLYGSARAYMEPYRSPYLGLDSADFWARMERCFAAVLACPDPDRDLRPDPALIPTITLDPPPQCWPAVEEYLRQEEDE